MKDKDRAVANATATGGAKFYGAICRTDIYSSDFLLDLYFAQNY
jgi:hypothetical protein